MTSLTQSIVKKTMVTVGARNAASARQLLIIFFQEIRICALQLPHLSAKKEYKALAMTAHKMAGACGYFGAHALYTHLLKVEALAKKSEIDPALFEVLAETLVLLDKVRKLEKRVLKALDKN